MTTRYMARSQSRFGVPGLPSGYDGKSSPEIAIPSVGIEDVDKSLFKLFNEQVSLVVGGDGAESKRVPVVFYAGEKWALNKKLRALRDRNGSLILPLVTAVRTSVVQDTTFDITGRGINQQTGEIVIHRRLDKSDRGYQNLINRLFLRHQSNLGVPPTVAGVNQLTTLREVGELAYDPIVQQGGLLASNRLNNVFETIVVPAPQFFTATYDVVLWAQYTTHMNQMIESLINSFLPQGNSWRLDTEKGYWFVANVDSNQYTADLNADDYSQAERVIKYRFTVKVPGYVLASNVPGAPVPIKRYVSSPTISFQAGTQGDVQLAGVGEVVEPFLGADDPTLPLDDSNIGRSHRTDQRRVNGTWLYPQKDELVAQDPALQAVPRGYQPAVYQKIVGVDNSGKKVTRLLRVRSRNVFTGETVLTGADLGGLTIVLGED